MGGSLSEYTVWLLERSMKTLAIRVKAHNKNAKKIAKWLLKHPLVNQVHYPGLKTHPNYKLAKKQMNGCTGMLSFELNESVNSDVFLKSLTLIKPSMSLAGVESTILAPSKTSHALLGEEERKNQGIIMYPSAIARTIMELVMSVRRNLLRPLAIVVVLKLELYVV